MKDFFKGIGKGVYNIAIIPVWAVSLVISAIVGLFVFIFVGIKKIIQFLTGRNISNELPEDIEAKKRIESLRHPEEKVEVVQAVIQDPRVVEVESRPTEPQIDNISHEEPIQIESTISEPVFDNVPSIEQKEEVPETSKEKEEEIIETYEPKAAKF